MVRVAVLSTLVSVVACTSAGSEEVDQPSDGKGDDGTDTASTTMKASPQRPGDPVRGRDYMLNGIYFPCGMPERVYRTLDDLGLVPSDGAPGANELGRRGKNATLPYFLTAYTAPSGVDMVTVNCLYCHGGRVDGELIVGLGDNAQDFTYPEAISGGLSFAGPMLADLFLSDAEAAEATRFLDRFGAVSSQIEMRTIGTNPGNQIPRILGAHRDGTTLAWNPTADASMLPPAGPAAVNVPPWWRIARKNQLYYTAEGLGDHARLLMSAAMYCADTPALAEEFDRNFVDAIAYIKSIQPPAYPYAIDGAKADVGARIYQNKCADCHGSYDGAPSYPNRWFPVEQVKTDALLAAQESSATAWKFIEWYDRSWYGTFGVTSRIRPNRGYVAPPLDGIWATAPFLHNGSVPNLETLLDSTKRPLYWTRDYTSSALDRTYVGVPYEELDYGQADAWSWEAEEIYDTTLPGHSADGHVYSDNLSATDRAALIEYLKTL